MPIYIIEGPSKSGKSTIANAMRNTRIGQGCGCLLVDEAQDGSPKVLIEKILVGIEVPKAAPADITALPWKKDPTVIMVGDKQAMLAEFEKMLPGFIDLMGPVYRVTIEAE
jgi:hypothetical protein